MTGLRHYEPGRPAWLYGSVGSLNRDLAVSDREAFCIVLGGWWVGSYYLAALVFGTIRWVQQGYRK
jgi:hypothetical protein